MRFPSGGGGLPAIFYTWRKAREVGLLRLWRAMRTKNTCKTCAVGMGGQAGGMVNESGHFPEVCKKSLQAMVADMQGAIPADFFETYSVAQLQKFSPRELEAAGRITTPLLYERGQDHYRAIDWPDAMERIVTKLKAIRPDETFWYFSGRSSNEAGFLLQLFARIYGTNNVNNCSYYCHQASGVGLTSVIGSGTATIVLDDLDQADLVFLIGGNPASNHPRLMTSLMNVRRRGGDVIVINPVVETGLVRFRVPSNVRSLMFGSKIASHYVQPHIGGDLALLTGIAKRVVETGSADETSLNRNCDGWPQLREALIGFDWRDIEGRCGVSFDEIARITDRYVAAKNVVFAWTMGITHHEHGVANVQAIANLALLRDMVGHPGAGLLPIRGHSNVQGIGSVGVTPKLKDAIFERLESRFNLKLSAQPGMDTLACMEAAGSGAAKFGFCLGGNLFGSNPDATFAAQALGNLEMLVYLSTTLNTGHAHALAAETLILPVLARDEEPQPTTQESMFNFVRLSDGGPPRHEGPKSEVEVITQLAEAVLGSVGPVNWHTMGNHRQIREWIAQVIPGFEKISRIDDTKEEFQIGGRTFHSPKFATHNGRAKLHIHTLPELKGGDGELRLMTVRSEGQFNTVVYEEEDIYRGQDRRDVILMHPEDLERFGVLADQRVSVYNDTGRLNNILVRAFDKIKPGNALMYYPEANVLVPRTADPASKTPAFKGVVVKVEATPTTTSRPQEAVVGGAG